MPQKEFVATMILAFDFEFFIDERVERWMGGQILQAAGSLSVLPRS
jgi:hypothetical protein